MANKIYQKEGVIGFGRGFSAAFYGSVIYGFTYFCIYKILKTKFKDYFDGAVDLAIVYLLASFTTEVLSLSVQYPFDLIKCRLQSVNYIFKYQNLPHAFHTEIKNNGVGALYRGSMPFLGAYASYVTLQFSIYERYMQYWKERLGTVKYAENEFKLNFQGGLIAGVIAAASTNSLEAITVAKQTHPEIILAKLIREQGMSLFTKGLLARVGYNAGQSVVFFNLVLYIGKLYNVELSED